MSSDKWAEEVIAVCVCVCVCVQRILEVIGLVFLVGLCGFFFSWAAGTCVEMPEDWYVMTHTHIHNHTYTITRHTHTRGRPRYPCQQAPITV